MIVFKKELVDKLIEHSRREFPNEACGLLVGRADKVEKIYEMTNADKSPETYFMDPKEQLKVTKEIRNSGLEMIGIYHSHVASPARPSAHDIEMAFYPEASYVIVSLGDKDNPSARSFKIKDGKINEEEIRIEKDR